MTKNYIKATKIKIIYDIIRIQTVISLNIFTSRTCYVFGIGVLTEATDPS